MFLFLFLPRGPLGFRRPQVRYFDLSFPRGAWAKGFCSGLAGVVGGGVVVEVLCLVVWLPF